MCPVEYMTAFFSPRTWTREEMRTSESETLTQRLWVSWDQDRHLYVCPVEGSSSLSHLMRPWVVSSLCVFILLYQDNGKRSSHKERPLTFLESHTSLPGLSNLETIILENRSEMCHLWANSWWLTDKTTPAFHRCTPSDFRQKPQDSNNNSSNQPYPNQPQIKCP